MTRHDVFKKNRKYIVTRVGSSHRHRKFDEVRICSSCYKINVRTDTQTHADRLITILSTSWLQIENIRIIIIFIINNVITGRHFAYRGQRPKLMDWLSRLE